MGQANSDRKSFSNISLGQPSESRSSAKIGQNFKEFFSL